MRTNFLLLFSTTILLGVAANSARAQSPVLTRAELFTHTNDDNKDHDTCINVSVRTQDGSSVLADAHNADCSGRDATEYNDGSENIVKLLVEAAGASKAACQGFIVAIGQHPNGHDTWKFNAKVTLYFSDGTTLVKGVDGVELHNEGSKTF